MSIPVRRRNYRSPLRAAQARQTRTAVIAAATKLFTERGWAGTAMRDIAREADVSMETVYANFGGKSQLLKTALDVAVVGDDEPSPLAERPLFRALSIGDLDARANATGVLLATMHARTARLRRVQQQAASGDADLTAMLDLSMSEERLSVEQGFTALAQRAPTKAELDVMSAVLSPDVYLLFVERSGWDNEGYRLWVADTVVRLFDL